MVATSPVMTALLSILLKVKPPSPLGLAGIALGLAGAVTIIIARNAGLGGGDAHWLLLAVLIPVFLGIGNVYRSMGWPQGAGMRLASAVNLAAVPPLLVLAWMWSGIDLEPLARVPLLVLGQLIASTIMYLTFFRLQAVGGPTYLSQIGYVAAVIGVGAGVTLLGESYPAMVWAGVAVVVAGVALTTLAQFRHQAPSKS